MFFNNIIRHPRKGWSVPVPSCSFTGEQSDCTGQETLDAIYQDRVGVSLKNYNIILILLTEDKMKKKSEVKQIKTFKVNFES